MCIQSHLDLSHSEAPTDCGSQLVVYENCQPFAKGGDLRLDSSHKPMLGKELQVIQDIICSHLHVSAARLELNGCTAF